MIRESTLIDREHTLNLPPADGVINGPLTLQTHTAIPQVLVLLIAPNIRTETVKSFASIKASIEYLNQFKEPAQLIEDEQVTVLLKVIFKKKNLIKNKLIIFCGFTLLKRRFCHLLISMTCTVVKLIK